MGADEMVFLYRDVPVETANTWAEVEEIVTRHWRAIRDDSRPDTRPRCLAVHAIDGCGWHAAYFDLDGERLVLAVRQAVIDELRPGRLH